MRVERILQIQKIACAKIQGLKSVGPKLRKSNWFIVVGASTSG